MQTIHTDTNEGRSADFKHELARAAAETCGRRFTIRFALGGGGVSSYRAFARPDCRPVDFLVSFVYLGALNKHRAKGAHYSTWVLDSGAFSAYNAGTTISLQGYIDMCKRLIETDHTLVEIFALDVIGDWKASLRNTEEMWRQGVPAIPTYHLNEPDHALKTMATTYPKIALGGVAQLRGTITKKLAWFDQCFARVWPKKIHGFGVGSETLIERLPFHSVDATSWLIRSARFGGYKAWGDRDGMPVPSSKINVRSNVDFYLDLQERMCRRWKRELDQLEALAPSKSLREQAKDIA